MTKCYLLNGVIFGLGVANGFVDAIGQVILIGNFVTTQGARLVASFHLIFNIGGIAGSLIMNRFLDAEMERTCPGEAQGPSARRLILLDDNYTYAYTIPAMVHIPVAVLLYVIYHLQLYEKLQQEKSSRISSADLQRENKVPNGVRSFIGVLLVVLFACASTQQNFMASVYQYSRCSVHVNATSIESTNNMIYLWIANTLGRLSIVLLVGIVPMGLFFAADCVAILSCLIVLSITSIITKTVFFVLVNVFGFCLGAVLPCSIIYAASVFRIEKGYMWVIYAGTQLLPIFNPVMCGKWMESDLNGFVYFNLGKYCYLCRIGYLLAALYLIESKIGVFVPNLTSNQSPNVYGKMGFIKNKPGTNSPTLLSTRYLIFNNQQLCRRQGLNLGPILK